MDTAFKKGFNQISDLSRMPTTSFTLKVGFPKTDVEKRGRLKIADLKRVDLGNFRLATRYLKVLPRDEGVEVHDICHGVFASLHGGRFNRAHPPLEEGGWRCC